MLLSPRNLGALLITFTLFLSNALAQSGPPAPPEALTPLNIWFFQDTNWLSVYGDPPITSTNLDLVTTWDNYGLQVDNASPARLQYHLVETDGWTNLILTHGTLRFWFLPNWLSTNLAGGTGPGDWGRLIDVGAWTSNASCGWWSLYLDSAGCNLYFSAQTNNGAGTNYFAAPISWDDATWHEIELTWSATNTVLYLDGAIATNGPGITILPPPPALTNGFYIGSDSTGLQQAHGQFDALWIFRTVQDDTNAIASEYAQTATLANPPRFHANDGPSPPGDGGSSGSGGGPVPLIVSYGSNDFYLETLSLGANIYNSDTNSLTLILHSTTNGTVYQLWSTTNLSPPMVWSVEQTFLGATNTNWTVMTFSMTNQPTLFFKAVNFSQDSDGDGLPDFWELQYGLNPTVPDTGTTGVLDAYKLVPIGDGLTYMDCFLANLNPAIWNTPPGPVGLSAQYTGTNGAITLSWRPSLGGVTNYTILRYDPLTFLPIYTLAGLTNQFLDTSPPSYTGNNLYNGIYSFYYVQANYSQGNSQWSAGVSPLYPTGEEGFSIAPNNCLLGLGGSTMLTIPNGSLNGDAVAVRFSVFGYDQFLNWGVTTNLDVPLSALTNGLYTFPTNFINSAVNSPLVMSQQVYSNGLTGIAWYVTLPLPFYDARSQLQQNINFVLRAASLTGPLEFTYSGKGIYQTNNYSFAGFNNRYAIASFGPFLGEGFIIGQNTPFEDNYFYRNFAFANTNVDGSGNLNTGSSGGDSSSWSLNDPLAFSFQTPTNLVWVGSQVPLQLDPSQTEWMMQYDNYTDLGIQTNGSNYYLPTTIKNYFGLPLLSVKLAYNTNQVVELDAGYNIPIPHTACHFYPNFAQPMLQTLGYYFASEDYGDGMDYLGVIDEIPGNDGFSPTNAQPPLFIASVGRAYQITGFAKQTITNGYSFYPVYVQQYFNQAFKATNGIVTSNTTGVLSPYGTFFPTEPGEAWLTTMVGTNGEQGQVPVYSIALCTDANHDGVIDATYSGPDFTSNANGSRAFQFWANDDDDSGDTGGKDIPGATGLAANGLSGQVNGVRDLIDFFPVHIDIGSLLQGLDTNTIRNLNVILKDDDDGALKFIYTSLTTNAPLTYLTDTNMAFSISNVSVESISPAGAQIPPAFLFNIRSNSAAGIILVEASRSTWKPLRLEIWQNGQLRGETELQLSISSVEQMFRFKNLISATYTNVPNTPSDRLTVLDVPNEPPTNDKNLVFLHGYNVNPNQARGWFAEMYKRFYWSGSHAKFYGVNYLGSEGQIAGRFTPSLETNIVHAFETAPHLSVFLNSLAGTNILAAHSLGNMVVLGAINYTNTSIDKFFMIDAAVAVEALDGSAAQSTNMIHPDWAVYTNRLWSSEWYKLFITNTNDYRGTLTWRDRLSNLGNTEVYNFYSSGEEVLREHVGEPPSITAAVFDQVVVDAIFGVNPIGCYTWAWQEKLKGGCPGDWILGSSHGGWRFNPYYENFDTNPELLPPTQAALLTDPQLRTNAFFDFTSGYHAFDQPLLGTNGSAYAQANRDRIISDAIPALTLPVGANPVSRLAPLGQTNRNFNMQVQFQNGWPLERIEGNEGNNWHHSDVHEVAYLYTYKLFDEIVNDGKLK